MILFIYSHTVAGKVTKEFSNAKDLVLHHFKVTEWKRQGQKIKHDLGADPFCDLPLDTLCSNQGGEDKVPRCFRLTGAGL